MMQVPSPDAPICCPHCQRAYSRAEHLQRHLATHGNERQFVCDHCPRRFHRRDLLKRHLKTCKPDLEIRFYTPSRSNPKLGDFPTQQRRTRYSNKPPNPDPRSRSPRESEIGFVSGWHPQSYLPNAQNSLINVSFASSAEQVQSEGPLDTTALPQLDATRLDDVETPSDFLGSIWDMSNEPSTHIGLSTPKSSMLDSCPGSLDILHSSYSAPLADGNWALSDCPDPVSKFVWLSHYSTACGLSSKFNYPKDTLTLGQVGRHAATTLGMSKLDQAFLGPHCDGGRFSELTDPHRSGREWAESLEFEFSSAELSNQSQWFSDPLVLQTNEIVSRIREAVERKPRNSIITFNWSPLLEDMCVSFFSPPNIRRLIDFFWSGWYPHWPVIHRPTFDPSTAPVILLASMMLIGACTSTDISDHRNARIWGNSVEEMAFSDEYFCGNIIIPAEQSHTTRRRLQALQAAHAICLYQYYEGDNVSKRRVRTYRYGAEVVMARELGFSSAKHNNLETLTRSTFSWQSFIAKEEMIRTLLYIFVLDSGFAISNNQPPRIVVQELDIELVCPEPCFQAATQGECFQHIRTWTSNRLWRKRMTVLSAIDSFQQMHMGIDAEDFFSQAGVLNLYIIAAALHSITFHIRLSLGVCLNSEALRNMLSNWKTVWNNRALPRNSAPFRIAAHDFGPTEHSCSDWRRDGFMEHAPELWLLSKKLLGGIASSKQRLVPRSSTSYQVISSHEPLGEIALELPAQEKYDDTSMSQLSHLLSSFESMTV